ncbi:unnamed protein product [Adineta ricciae]|uniref:Uncharacterized protein n=1 Tax=Adineta ricciae TaxID=249248 RepID=A0A815YM19_ADIRI|nr:unnamed protein product [Adineta ricciae]
MGSVSSTCCGRQQRPKLITIIHDGSAQTRYPLTSCLKNSFYHPQHTNRNSMTRFRSADASKSSQNYVSIRTEPLRVRSRPSILRNTSSQYATNNSSHRVRRSASMPVNTFVIDISKRQVRVGQPVSMNIRHVVFDVSEDSSPTTDPTCTKNNLLESIPRICDKYPNLLSSNPRQAIRKTLHTNFQI